MMKIFDEKLKGHKVQFMFQALLGGLAVGTALCFFDVVKNPMIVASFGSSTFVAFTMPHRELSRTRFLIGGYIVGITSGVLMHNITLIPIDSYMLEKAVYILSGGGAAALAIFLMGLINAEHAAGTSIAIGFALNTWTYQTIILVLLGITVIALLKKSLKRFMIDLI
ncbi:MAG: HPP family protein [Candidatus Aadella gelida]|nr:HPP family protein [Candidatus Aadella gelida]